MDRPWVTILESMIYNNLLSLEYQGIFQILSQFWLHTVVNEQLPVLSIFLNVMVLPSEF